MPINGAVLNEDGTYTPAGGTSITFDATGEQVANGVVCVNAAETDFYAREKLIAKSRVPVVGSDGDYSKMKNSCSIVRPLVLASGKTVYNLIRIELEVHPEAASTEVGNLKSLGSSALCDTDMDDFWELGSLK